MLLDGRIKSGHDNGGCPVAAAAKDELACALGRRAV
jgi:hypothetical protein